MTTRMKVSSPSRFYIRNDGPTVVETDYWGSSHRARRSNLHGRCGVGWWWADPVAALATVPIIVREGLEGLQAEACNDCSPR